MARKKKVRKKDPTNPRAKDQAVGLWNLIWKKALAFCGGDRVMAAKLANESALAGLGPTMDKWLAEKREFDSLAVMACGSLPDSSGPEKPPPSGPPSAPPTSQVTGQQNPGECLHGDSCTVAPALAQVSQVTDQTPDKGLIFHDMATPGMNDLPVVEISPCKVEMPVFETAPVGGPPINLVLSEEEEDTVILDWPVLIPGCPVSPFHQARLAFRNYEWTMPVVPELQNKMAVFEKPEPCFVCANNYRPLLPKRKGFWVTTLNLRDRTRQPRKLCKMHLDIMYDVWTMDYAGKFPVMVDGRWYMVPIKYIDPATFRLFQHVRLAI